jgi:hypothetical protein
MTDTIALTMSATPRLRGVATLVLGGIGSRLDLPFETMDDLQLAVLSVLDASAADTVTIEVTANDELVAVEIGPLQDGSNEDAGLHRVLDRLVDDVQANSREGRDWLTLTLARARPDSG